MKILHIAAHLGGGVGKAHAALCKASSAEVERQYALLESPRDRRYVEQVLATGASITEAPTTTELARMASLADIVQIEWWNHPALYEIVCKTNFPMMRTIFWCHISGLFAPLIPQALLSAGHRFVFTSDCSFKSSNVLTLSLSERVRLYSISSGFGFEDVNGAPASMRHASNICYLGTLDFVKISPRLFDVVDAVEADELKITVWGNYDPEGDVAATIRKMHHPERVLLRGHASDAETALKECGIFLYLLQPQHYGTAENALVEAMSLGCVPLVFANPAESVLVEHGVTGYLAHDTASAVELLTSMLRDPDKLGEIGANAMKFTARHRTANHTASRFNALYRDVCTEEKRPIRFDSFLGSSGAEWFLSTQINAALPHADIGNLIQNFDTPSTEAKGTLAHFRASLPHDISLFP